ncbi:MAG: competence protein TfoX [Caulobacter sp.]|nr:competence protein TfoX [Caulobacter sp.]
MFGGVGLYAEGLFFALIASDVLYLKTDATTRPAFEAADSQPFRPGNGAALSYWSAPIEALDDPELMVDWARRAIAAARRAKA